MPNNDEIREALTRSQAEAGQKINDQLTELAEIQRKIEAERDKINVERDRIEAERTKLAEERSAVASAKDSLLSDKQALLDDQQRLIEDQQLLAKGLADLNQWEAEKATLLPKISALIESNQDANKRESKRDAVIDSWGNSLTRIEATSESTAISITEIHAAIKAGFDAVNLTLKDSNELSERISVAVNSIGEGQAKLASDMHTRFNESDVSINAVHTSVDKIGQMVTRMMDFVVNITGLVEKNNERIDAIEKEIFSIKNYTKTIVKFFSDKIIDHLSAFSEIPGKVETQVRNLNSSIAKIRGESDSLVSKFSKYAENIGHKTEAFEDQVLAIKELAVTLRGNLSRGVEVELAKLEGTLTGFATEAVKSYNEVLKKSEMYEILAQVNAVMERVNLATIETNQLVVDVKGVVGDVDGSIKRNSVDLIESLSISSKAIVSSFDGIERSVHNTNSIVSDSVARIDLMGGKFTDLNTKLVSVAGSVEGLMSLSTQTAIQVAKQVVEVFTPMFADLPGQVSAMVSEAVTEADNSAIVKMLGGDTPDEKQ